MPEEVIVALLALLPFANANDWARLARHRPPLSRVLAFPVLPLALLPPVALYVAGSLHPAAFPAALAHVSWALLGVAFLAVEAITLLAMGWLIRQVAASSRLAVDTDAAYLIASLAPVPLWLASLALFVPDVAVTITLAVLALGLCCRAVFHGVVALGGASEPVTAAWITQIAVGGGLIPWVLLAGALL